MRPLRFLSVALLLASTAPLAAQYVQPLPQTSTRTDADALADQVRALAANPNDLNALIRAGELAIKLDDPTAAGTFFARAERIDPRNARVKAGTAVLLVQSERPGEALRRFAEAESYGGRVASFAADRGLAFDLVGEQERAQRDYRLALKTAPDDETTRRYALSLGISGKRDEALALLDPLLRKSDRGAWRARAFILAMGGDKAGAEQIAVTMMPAGLAQGLQPFFDRLPMLPPVDRAFAVHFGETRPSAQRYADARMVPMLPPLGPDPDARELAAAAKAREKPVRVEVAKPAKRKRNKREPVELAVQTVAPPAPPPLPPPPTYVDPSASRASAAPGQGGYYVQPLPAPRPYTPSYSYGAVAQANRAAAATMPVTRAPVAVPQPQVTPSYQPVQPTGAAAMPVTRAPVAVPQAQVTPSYQPVQAAGGRVMPLAPLQPQPLPSGITTPSRVPSRATPPVETATKVIPFPQTATPALPARTQTAPLTPPVETATRVVPAAPATPAYAVPTYPAPAAETATRVVPAPQPYAPTPAPLQSAARPPQNSTAYPAAQTAPQPSYVASAPASPAQSYPPTAPASGERARSEDAILSGIIAGIGVPGRELGVAPVEPARPAPIAQPVAGPVRTAPVEVATIKAPARSEPQHRKTPADDAEVTTSSGGRRSATAKAVEAEDEADRKKPTDARKAGGRKTSDTDASSDLKKSADTKKTSAKKTVEPDEAADTPKGSSAKKAAGKKTTAAEDDTDTRKGAGSKKASGKKAQEADEADADIRKGADKKADAKKKGADAKKKDTKALEPSRVWVQVSGGANENDLPKQWNKLRTDKPGAFKGRQGWSTPLRATNRILTGPFASEAEAQSYVNKLAKQGLSGFVFTSDPGQKIDKLPAK